MSEIKVGSVDQSVIEKYAAGTLDPESIALLEWVRDRDYDVQRRIVKALRSDDDKNAHIPEPLLSEAWMVANGCDSLDMRVKLARYGSRARPLPRTAQDAAEKFLQDFKVGSFNIHGLKSLAYDDLSACIFARTVGFADVTIKLVNGEVWLCVEANDHFDADEHSGLVGVVIQGSDAHYNFDCDLGKCVDHRWSVQLEGSVHMMKVFLDNPVPTVRIIAESVD